MRQPASCSVEFDRHCNAGRNTGGHAKKETKAKAVPDAEDDGVGHRAGKQPQRAMLSTQQVVGQVKTPKNIEKSARDADGCDCMVVHSIIEANTQVVMVPFHGREVGGPSSAPALGESESSRTKIVIPRALPEGPCVPRLHEGPRQNTRSLAAEATRDDVVFVFANPPSS